MKNNKNFLFAILSMLAISSLVACGGGNKPTPSSSQPEEEEEERPLEIGDTVKEWIDSSKYEGLPMDVPEGITGTREIVDDFGNGDNVSLHYSIKAGSDGTGYIDSGVVEEPLFTEDDGKNGDIISLFVYIPANSNLAELKLEIYSSPGQGWNSNQEVVEGTKVEVNSDKQEKWIRLEGSFDCLYTFGSVRLNYTPVDAAQEVEFYVDNVNITLGEETVETEYTSVEGESLYQAFEDYFKVGACMSASMLRNTTLRKIAKEQFNSLTAEILIALNVFSQILTISAVEHEETGTKVFTNLEYKPMAFFLHSSVTPLITLGTLSKFDRGFPGSSRSGEYPK